MVNRSGIWDLRQVGVNEVNQFWKTSYPNSRALFGGGVNSDGNLMNNIQQLEIGTLGNSTDFGDLVVAVKNTSAGIASITRGIFHGSDRS